MKLFIDIGVIVITILMMLAVGLDLNRQTIIEIFRQRSKHLILLGCQIIIPPLIGIALAILLPLPPYLAASILLLAACPIGDIANVYTIVARGNPALSLTLNAVTCLLAPVTMLASFALMRQLGIQHDLLAVPALALIGRLTAFLFLPVAVGAMISGRCPAVAQRIRQPLHRSVGLGIALLLSIVLWSQWDNVAAKGLPMALVSLAFMIACLGAGAACGKLLKLPSGSARASLLCFPVRNVGVATLIAVTLLGRLDYAGVAAVYFITEVPLLFLVCWILRRRTWRV